MRPAEVKVSSGWDDLAGHDIGALELNEVVSAAGYAGPHRP